MDRFYGDSLMKVSIITATYNSEKTLKTCLDSVAQQSARADIEHIIVDGRSSDATLALVNQYPHVSKIVSDKDRGIYHAFNRGVELATGDLIYFLNSDDSLYDDNVIADVLAEFTSETDYYCGVIFCINEQTKQSYFSETLKDDAINFNPPHQAFFCRRELFDKLGPFNECLTITADTYFMKQSIQKTKGVFSPRAIARFSLQGLSSSESSRAKVLAQDVIVDNLLGLSTIQSKLSERMAIQIQNLLLIKQLMLNMLQGNLDLSALMGKRLAIFGARELSQVFYHFFSQKNINVIGFVVSSDDNLPVYTDVPILSLQDLKQAAPDLVLNCIEGSHEDDVTKRIVLFCPGVNVLSWRDFGSKRRVSSRHNLVSVSQNVESF